jgi:hypothetical protein
MGALSLALGGAVFAGFQAGAQQTPKEEPQRKLNVGEVLSVGDEVITAEDLIARIWDYEFMLKPEQRILTDSLTYLRDNVALVDLETRRMGLTLTPEEIERETARQLEHWKNYAKTESRGMMTWEDFLKQLGLTNEGFTKYLQDRAPVLLKKRVLVGYFEQTTPSIDSSHILFGPNDLARAQETYRTLKNTSKEKFSDVFEDLAVQRGVDPRAGVTRGRLPRIYEEDGTLISDVAEPLWALKDGEFTEPIKTQYGYHICWRRQTFTPPKRPLSELRDARITEAPRENDDERFTRWVRWVINTQKYKVERRLPGLDCPPNEPMPNKKGD